MRRSTPRSNATAGRDHFNSGAIVVMETDGKVRAIVGGPDYGESQFNRATHAKRQPGSSFKVYVYATAMENGYTPDTIVRDGSRSCGNWSPSNYGGGGGSGARMPLWSALARSLNTVATELSFAVGRDKVIEMTKRLGIEGVKKTCSMALGDGGITVLEHTGGFATFANGGKLARPYGILDITTSRGDLLYSRERDEPPPRQVLSRHVAEEMNTMMNRVVTEGTAGAAQLDFTNVAGKTGTSTGPKDVWFVGFTGKYVAGVWLGNDDNHPMRAGVTGGHQAAPVWHDLMTVAHTDMNIPTIPGLAPHPRQIEEQQRLAEVKAAQVAAGIDTEASEAAAKSEKLMPEKTREALKTLTAALRKASGGGDVTPARPASMTSPSSQPPQSPPATSNTPEAPDDTPKPAASALPAKPIAARRSSICRRTTFRHRPQHRCRCRRKPPSLVPAPGRNRRRASVASIEIGSYEPPSDANLARSVARILLRAIGLTMTIAVAVAVGIWSSQFMVSRGSLLSTDSYGPWQHWRNLGRDFADPYTKAHIANSGKLRIASNSAGIFEARTDNLGARLHSSCNYVIEGSNMSGMWWSLAVFDARGRLIANDAESLHLHGRYRRAQPEWIIYRHARPRRPTRQLAADEWRRPPGACPHDPRPIDGPFGRSARRTQQDAAHHTPRGLLMNLKSLLRAHRLAADNDLHPGRGHRARRRNIPGGQ